MEVAAVVDVGAPPDAVDSLDVEPTSGGVARSVVVMRLGCCWGAKAMDSWGRRMATRQNTKVRCIMVFVGQVR